MKALLYDKSGCETLISNQQDADGTLFKKILTENYVAVRTLARLGSGILSHWSLNDILSNESLRVKKNLEFLSKIKDVFDGERIEYLIIKSLDNYPDIGRDLDVLILDNKQKVIKLLVSQFEGTVAKPIITEILADKTNIDFNNLPTIEIHHGRLGQIGEDTIYPKVLMKNKKLENFSDYTFLVPRDEDKVILAAYHRIHRHFRIRICDIYNTIIFMKKRDFDWGYLWKTTEAMNLADMLRFYLDYINKIEAIITQQKDLTFSLDKLPVKKSFFRYPLFRITTKIYSKKFLGLIKSLDVAGALRMCLILPVLLIAFINKLLGRKARW